MWCGRGPGRGVGVWVWVCVGCGCGYGRGCFFFGFFACYFCFFVKHQKYKGRVVLRGDVVKDNSGS